MLQKSKQMIETKHSRTLMKRSRGFTLLLLLLFAFTMLSACKQTNTEIEEDYRTQGIALMDAGEYEAALTMFNEALAESVGVVSNLEVDICMYKGIVLYNLERYDEALETYNAVIDFDTQNAYAYYYRGTIELECGDEKAAVSDYSQAAALDGTYAMFIAIGENLKEKGLDTQASGYLRQALLLNPKDVDEKRNQAYVYYLNGEEETARTIYEELATDGDEESLVYLSMFAMDAGNYDMALSYIEQGLNLNGSHYGEFLYQKGVCYEYKEDYVTARDVFTRYLEIYPDDAEAQRELTFLSTRE